MEPGGSMPHSQGLSNTIMNGNQKSNVALTKDLHWVLLRTKLFLLNPIFFLLKIISPTINEVNLSLSAGALYWTISKFIFL